LLSSTGWRSRHFYPAQPLKHPLQSGDRIAAVVILLLGYKPALANVRFIRALCTVIGSTIRPAHCRQR
jgi:hypothetical protein